MAIVGGSYTGGVWTSTGAGSYDNMMDRTLERPVSAEWLYPAGGRGLPDRLRPARARQRLYAAPLYSAERLLVRQRQDRPAPVFPGRVRAEDLAYPLFPQSNAEQFADIVLRAGHNDETNPFIKDELVRRLYQDMGQASCTGTFANLFIDGEYKGYYNPTEHIKEAACQQWFDSDRSWDVIAMDGVRNGDTVSWDATINYARSHNLADPAYYAELCKKLDVVSFIDFLIIRLWPNDWDWPQNNWAAACERSATGQWKFFVWDAEGTFDPSQLSLDRFGELNIQTDAIEYLYQALKASPDFRLLFADRVYKHFYNGGALTDGNIQKRYLELHDALLSVIPNMDRYIIDTWTPNRLPVFLSACVREGMYTFAGPDFAINDVPQYGGQVSRGDRLSMILPGRRGDDLLYPGRGRPGGRATCSRCRL